MSEKLVILVAEDDENDVYLLTRALQRADIAAGLHFVDDGQYVMDYLSGTGQYADRELYPLPHFAFLDLKMPRKNGFEALQWLREHPQFNKIPVLIISASGEEKDIQRAHSLGANAYVVKPSDQNELASEVKKFCLAWWPASVRRKPPEEGHGHAA